jgi:chemotaxis-related protein WspB
MLYLLLHAGAHRLALEVEQVCEVLPLVDLRPLPSAQPGVVGAFDYRGEAVPAIDLTALTEGRPSARRLSTRMVVVRAGGLAGAPRRIGLLAERVTEIVRREPETFRPHVVPARGVSFLDAVATDDAGLLQRLELAALLAACGADASRPSGAG